MIDFIIEGFSDSFLDALIWAFFINPFTVFIAFGLFSRLMGWLDVDHTRGKK